MRILSLLLLFLLSCSSRNDIQKDIVNSEIFTQLSKLPAVPVFDGDLFMVFAHSDDELLTLSYVASVYEKYPNKKIHWILVTDSGGGWVSPVACAFKSAAKCRSEEAKEVSKCLGISEPIEMKLADGKLSQIKNLESLIESKILELNTTKVGLVLTSDNTGVYGHPDHLAVHDAVKNISIKNKWKMLTGALPQPFREKIKLRKGAESRVDPPVTHVVHLTEKIKQQLVCSIKAHRSQKFMLWALRQRMSPEGFLNKIPIQFYSIVVSD